MPIKRRQPGVEPYDRKWLEAVHTTPKYDRMRFGQNLEEIAQKQEQQKKEQKEAEAEARAKGKGGEGPARRPGSSSADAGTVEKVLDESGDSKGEEGKGGEHDDKPPSWKWNPMGKTEVPGQIKSTRQSVVSRCARYGLDGDRFMRDDTYMGNFKLIGDKPKVKLPDTAPYYKKKIAASMIDNQFDREIRNQRRGNLDYGSLYKAKTGSDRVFKKREEPKNKKYCIGFLYDKSGSMHGSKTRAVVKTIYTIHDMLYSLPGMRIYEGYFDTDFKLLSHPDWRRSGYEVAAKYAHMIQGPGRTHKGASDYEPSFREVKDGIQKLYKKEIQDYEADLLAYDGENNDGEAVERMVKWMSHEDETVSHKILFVVGDGGIGSGVQEDIKTRIIPDAKNKYGIDVVGISIGATEMQRIYANLITVRSDAADLPELLASKVASLIKRG